MALSLVSRVRTAYHAVADALSGRVIRRSPFWRPSLQITNVTPELIESALRAAATVGDLTYLGDIHDMMPATDPHLYGVRRQLRAGVSGIKFGLVPVNESPEAQKVADLVRTAEERPGVNNAALTNNLIEGSLRGSSVTEVIWEEPEVGKIRYWKGFAAVPEQQLRYDAITGALCVVDDPKKLSTGTPVTDYLPGKFVRAQVDTDVPDFSMRGGYRSVINDWFGRVNVGKWEQIAIERFGMPIPVGKYATQTSHNALLKAMNEFGAAGMLLIDDKSSVEMAAQGVGTSGNLIHEVYLEKSAERISVAILGATQTATIGKDAGSQTSSNIHQGIRRDVLYSLLVLIADAKRRDLWEPFVRMNLGEAAVALTPTAEPEFDEPIDLLTTAQAWDVLINRVGLPISKAYVYEQTGIEEVGVDEELLGGAPPAPAPSAPVLPGGGTLPISGPAATTGPPLLPPPLPFRKPFRGDVAPPAEAAKPEPTHEPPSDFGDEVTDALKKIAHSGDPLSEIHRRLNAAEVPTRRTTDALAAAMLDATMRALSAEPNPEEE